MEKHRQRSIHPNFVWSPSSLASFTSPTTTSSLPLSSVYGPSMLPTLNLTGDVLLVEHVSHRFQKVGPGDVVLVRSPLDPTKMVTKRIVGMEGDQINFLPDPSITDICRTIMVPKGHIWIQGDNMHASCDSRHYGPVPYGLVQGKLFFRVWPPSGFGSFDQ
ncbi:PROTEASE FAMILY S26 MITOCHONDRIAL INNER MEMBRANE PROTEASE-RELATED [Salix koriyanagi]|uniref:PROTEASE FAMILY S26 MITOCHONDRIAL INNER MEMBRANE PROTEASE-RELATED n=1 Tax=Salix koriyanagi TaxID=2511006 RepID=A0A9Q0WYZ0_9ROSI|nr:PROTEASE FAMILY S26 MITOCHONDRIAL INNER MEMBRANE PROTEASE-RELATED [Salix koriyanagi]